jgi:hypothetical protein
MTTAELFKIAVIRYVSAGCLDLGCAKESK